MANDAREMMIFLADGYEKLASYFPGDLQAALQALPPNASDEARAHLEGYCEGHPQGISRHGGRPPQSAAR
jgi:hypothetical protein